MIDLHSHILPGIDDGAKDLPSAIALLKQSADQGVRQMVFTPHITPDVFNNSRSIIAECFAQVKDALSEAVAIKMSFAAEVRIHADLPFAIQSGEIPLFSGKNEQSVLLELPSRDVPASAEFIFEWLLSENIRPILAHPERNEVLQNTPEKIRKWAGSGVSMQITAGSLLGDFGKYAEELALAMVQQELCTLVASDIHNQAYRPNRMHEAYRLIQNRYSEDIAHQLFVSNPALICQEMF